MTDDYEHDSVPQKIRRALWRLRSWPSVWRSKHRNATCDLCGYSTHQSRLRQLIGWTACPACWEEGGVLIRYTRNGISTSRGVAND